MVRATGPDVRDKGGDRERRPGSGRDREAAARRRGAVRVRDPDPVANADDDVQQ